MNFPFGNANAACQVLWGNFLGDTVGVFFSTFTWTFKAVFGKWFYHVTSWHPHSCFTSIFVEAIFAPHRICFRVVIFFSNPGIPRWKIHSCRWVAGKSLRCSIIKSYGRIPEKWHYIQKDARSQRGTLVNRPIPDRFRTQMVEKMMQLQRLILLMEEILHHLR